MNLAPRILAAALASQSVMKKIFYSTLVLLLIASLTGLAIATAVLPFEPIVPAPARSLVLPARLDPAS